jgi:hypothetical protein
MVKRSYNTEDKEPTEQNFKIPSEKEHLFQVVDVNPLVTPSGEDQNIQIVKLEIVDGEEEGLTLLNRVNLDSNWKGFYFTSLFLKAIGEPYKGLFDVETDRWFGRQFYATVKHSKSKDGTKTYANIGEYNFNKPVEQYKAPVGESVSNITDPKDIQWEN